ncbi:flavin reductase [Robiginitalea sediminis]|uniref:flavin reductase n=1 Tax=Robiginitalea sediminis TaxID=1982593 RepID=UPI000B4B7C46|nr:flavin reductase [Robiginitalea sediminis]
MEDFPLAGFETLDTRLPVWSRFYMVAPLVVIGTREGEGYDLAPKHMVTPMGFGNYIGFVCTPDHSTYHNIRQHGVFTVSFPLPEQTLITSLSATRRSGEIPKSEQVLDWLPTVTAPQTDAPFLQDSYLLLECDHFKTIDGFGRNSLITGTIRKAYVRNEYLRISEADEQAMLREHPLLAYVAEGRFAIVGDTYAFPFPKNFKR